MLNIHTHAKTSWRNLAGCSLLTMSLSLLGCGSDSNNNAPSISNDTNIQADEIIGSETVTPAVESGNFSIVVIPDTQKYAQYSPERFYAQTEWIAQNYKDYNIKFTTHLGDIVEKTWMQNADGTYGPNVIQWEVATKAMGILDANPATPYSILAGNHDIIEPGPYEREAPFEAFFSDTNRQAVHDDNGYWTPAFLTYFSVHKQQSNFATFQGSDETGFNSYHIFNDDDGQQYLVMALDWRPSDATLKWANDVLDQHSNIPTILTTHQLMDIENNEAVFTENGKRLWDKLIKDNDQIFLTLNGHHHGEAIKTAKNSYGRDVYLMVVDYQSGYFGGNGMMQLIEFDKANNELDFRSFSPWVLKTAKEDRQPQDQLERWTFSKPLDFNKRFVNLNQPTFTNAKGNIQNTVAYWILDNDHQITGANGNISFADLSGNGNHMSLTGFPANTKPLESVFAIVDDAPSFGYANGSAKFMTNESRNQDGAFLVTKGSIPQDGKLDTFTLEAIVKISPEWTAEANRWSGIFAQVPGERDVCNYHVEISCGSGGSGGGLFVSSLAEIQYYGVAGNSDSSSNWSWELNRDYWYHIAVVNDGTYNTLYVDGSKVMRTHEKEQPGWYSLPNSQWTIGVASDSAETLQEANANQALLRQFHSLFRGQIAEVRLTERALDRSEWLYYAQHK